MLVAEVKRVGGKSLATPKRSHRNAGQTAAYLLPREANEPLQTVAVGFGISRSRVWKLQQGIESAPVTSQQAHAFAKCKV